MAENMKEDLGMAEIEIKEKICSSYRLVETCTEDVQEDDVQMENEEIKGGNLWPFFGYFLKMFILLVFLTSIPWSKSVKSSLKVN